MWRVNQALVALSYDWTAKGHGDTFMAAPHQTVAVIDDDESVCRALQRLLRSEEIETDTFTSGEAFLDTLRSVKSPLPRCLIVDVQMPGMDGLELQRYLAPTGVPIIFVTANDDEAVRAEALARGAAGFLNKPLDAALLISTVLIALGRPQSATSAAAP